MSTDLPPLEPAVALAVVAHPDDIEVCFGGTLAAWALRGIAIHYLILTDGSNGSEDSSITEDSLKHIRQSEQRAAADVIGVKSISFADYKDGELTNSLEVRRDIVRVIRQTKPDVVLTFDPTNVYSAARGIINHPDHRAAGQAALDAVFPLARDHLAFPELAEENILPHITKSVLLNNYDVHNYFIDISNTMDTKLRALGAHVSQFTSMDEIERHMRDWGAQLGARIDVRYAEGFMRIDVR